MSALEDIAIYTTGEDMPLKEVLKKIAEKEDKGPSINVKNPPEELKKYFEEVLPEYDKERVYFSDIKKVITLYNLLQEKSLLKFEEEQEKEEKEGEEKEIKTEADI